MEEETWQYGCVGGDPCLVFKDGGYCITAAEKEND